MALILVLVATGSCVGIEADNRDLAGLVTRVIDGDTLELTVAGNRLLLIRLSQIDAPEKSQPYGERATSALSALTLGKRVSVEVADVDRYGRTVGEIYTNDLYVNAEMVRQGHAWAYTRYAKSMSIIELEDEARQHERGLWKLPLAQRDPPWVWRRSRSSKSPRVDEDAIADTVCGTKRSCREMVSCAEARFYLSSCGLAGLDGDGDGTPCESKCWE